MINIAAIKAQALNEKANPAQVRALLRGELTMRPHPTWSMPTRLSWAEDPFQDKNWRYQLHMLRWLAPLDDAGREGDSEAASKWLTYVIDWIENNPPGAGRTEAAWANMVDGIRVLHLIRALPMIAEHFPESMPLLETSIAEHAVWISDEEHLGHSNHALHQHEALLMCGIALENASWTELALKRIGQLLHSEWDSEGINAEGAIAYHRNNYVWWHRLIRRIEIAGLSLPDGVEKLEKAPIALAHATRPDGVFVPIGDTDGGAAKYIDHPACKYVTTKGSQGAPPDELIRVYSDGYAFGRSGWGEFERDMSDETYFAIPFGRYKVHGHADGGSLVFSSVGVNWITDPGKYSYTASDPFRRHVVAHNSHSLLYIEGVTRDLKAAVPLVSHRESEGVWDLTVKDDGYRDVNLSRRVIYSTSGEYLVVLDTVRCDREVTGVQRWQLGEGVDITQTENHLVKLQSGATHAGIYSSGTRPNVSVIHTDSDEQLHGRISTGWKKSTTAPVLELRKSGKAFRFITVLSAGRKQRPTFATVKGVPAGAIALSVDNGASQETIVISGRRVQIMRGTATGEDVGRTLQSASKNISINVSSKDKKRANPLSRSQRETIISTIRSARSSGRNLSQLERRDLAKDLESELMPFFEGAEFDLGLDACLRDLRMDTTRRSPDLSTTRAALINWDQDPAWRPTYYNAPLWTHFGGWNSDAPLNFTGLHSVDLGSLVLPTILELHPGTVLTVMFHGALNRTKSKLPVFQRMAVQRELAAGPILGLSDATLDLGPQLRLGWYLGLGDLDLTAAIADLVRGVAGNLGINHVVLQGNSGGGFAAMQVAAQIPDAHVVVFSPQTDIRRYFPAQATRVFNCVFGQRGEPTSARARRRLSVADRVRETGTLGSSLTYVSNPGDNLHVANHEAPLLDAIETQGIPTTVHRVSHYLGEGHKSVDNDQYKKVMTDVYEQLR